MAAKSRQIREKVIYQPKNMIKTNKIDPFEIVFDPYKFISGIAVLLIVSSNFVFNIHFEVISGFFWCINMFQIQDGGQNDLSKLRVI